MHREPSPQDRWPERANHEHFLFEGAPFPATKEDLVDYATEADVDIDTMNLVRSLPVRTYADPNDVWRAVGEGIRAMIGREGTPRDDIGKEAVITPQGFARP